MPPLRAGARGRTAPALLAGPLLLAALALGLLGLLPPAPAAARQQQWAVGHFPRLQSVPHPRSPAPSSSSSVARFRPAGPLPTQHASEARASFRGEEPASADSISAAPANHNGRRPADWWAACLAVALAVAAAGRWAAGRLPRRRPAVGLVWHAAAAQEAPAGVAAAQRDVVRARDVARAREAAPRRDPPPAPAAEGGGGAARNPEGAGTEPSSLSTIRISNMPPNCTWLDLRRHFAVAGEVAFAEVFTRRGLVRFRREEDAARAIELMRDRPLRGVQLKLVLGGRGWSDEEAPPEQEGPVMEESSPAPEEAWPATEKWEDWQETMGPDAADPMATERSPSTSTSTAAARQARQRTALPSSTSADRRTPRDRNSWAGRAAPQAAPAATPAGLPQRAWRRYDRDLAADGSDLDRKLADKVEELVARWEKCRQVGNWDEADSIREGLWAMGVMMEERTGEWMVVPVGPRAQKDSAIFIWDIPQAVTRSQLLDHCSAFGRVLYCGLIPPQRKGPKRGLVRFWTDAEAAAAVEQLPTRPLLGAVLQADIDRFIVPPNSLAASIKAGDARRLWSRDSADAKSEEKPDAVFVREVQELLVRRDVLRARGMQTQAEALRDKLRKKGVIINDASHTWFRLDPELYEPTAVIVSNLPEWTTWLQLREHFAQCGSVRFATLFKDRETGQPSGGGVVRFDTPEAAVNALEMMPTCPLDGAVLKVRLDRSGPPKSGPARKPWKRHEQDVVDDPSADDVAFADRVQEQVEERQRMRDMGKFDYADAIREELWSQLVVLDDDSRTWYVQRMDREAPGDYNTVIVRNLPKWATNYALRDHFYAFGRVRFAAVFQKAATGEPTGAGIVRFDSEQSAKAAVLRSDRYPMHGTLLEVFPDRRIGPGEAPPSATARWVRDKRDATADGSEEDKEFAKFVQQQLAKRQTLRDNREFEKADEIAQDLQARGVVVNGLQRTWSFGPINSFPWVRAENDDAATGTEEDKDFERRVQRLLNLRQAAKYQRDYAKADKIEDELWGLGIRMDSGKRVWWCGRLTA